MTLRAGRVTKGRVRSSRVVDDRVCECCQTAAAVTSEGPFVVYRDRSEDEVRNIAIIRGTPRGFTAPRPVHDDGWKTPGCPVNGPAADADGRRAVVAWYTGAELGRIRVGFSNDAGATFAVREVHDHPDAIPLGRVDVVLAEGGAFVSWLVADDDERARIVYRFVSEKGPRGPPRTVAVTTPARSSGFPKMVDRGADLYFVWTEVEGNTTRIRGRTIARGAEGATTEPNRSTATRTSIASYAAEDLAGRATRLADLTGPVILNIWATWCGPCRREMPELERLSKTHPELTVVGVNVDEAGADARVAEVVKRTGVSYPIWRDREDRASRLLEATSLPVTLLLDAKRRVVHRVDGALSPTDPAWRRALSQVLSNTKKTP